MMASRFKQGHMHAAGGDKADLTSGLEGPQIESQIAHLERQRGELDSALQELREALAKLQTGKND